MSSSNCSTVEGSSATPSTTSQATAAHSQDTAETILLEDEKAEQIGRKRKRNKRGRSSDDRTSEKPRRERANFNAAQLHALERLFHDQKYPDGDLRAKIAKRLDLNDERVQIWFQNRRAKYKRLQREGGCTFPDEPSPLAPYDYGQPSSMDYIPPQLDADMLGPDPCTIQTFPQQTTAAAAPLAIATDLHPASDVAAPSTNLLMEATIQGEASDGHHLAPFSNGLPMHQQQQMNNDYHQHHSTIEWTKWSNLINQGPANSPQSTDGMQHEVMDVQSVGKFIGTESVEFPTTIDQAHMNVAAAPVGASTHVLRSVGTMRPTVESWNGKSLEGVETVPRVPSEKTGRCLSLCRTGTRSLPVIRVAPSVAPSACSHSRLHSGEAPCHKDSKCITCREKPPPNKVCTALLAGEHKELDDALYRCAVGSILGIRSLTPEPHSRTNGSTPHPAPKTPSTTEVTGSLDKSPLKRSTGAKSAKTTREISLSAQRRMAMVRKQRQIEADYLSSSSESSSDWEEESQRKRRRKVARRSNGAPPNRVCTAVPLMDRTLPLPCLTKDLALDNYIDGDKTSAGQLLHPPEEFPSCLPSPISLDRLSSPEPQSPPSERPEYTSSSSSDLSDFEYIRPPPTIRSLSSTTSATNSTTSVQKPIEILQTQSSVGGETASVTANRAHCALIQHNGHHPPYLLRPEPNYMPASSCTYPNGIPTHTSEAMPQTRPRGVLSSVPPPFVMELEPATLSSSENSSDKGAKAGNPCVSFSAGDENRRNQTWEVLTESRIVGDMCSSPASPWSNCSLPSPHFNQQSPQTPELYPRLMKPSNEPHASTFQRTHTVPCALPVPSTQTGTIADVNASISHVYFKPSTRVSTADAPMHYQPPLLHHNRHENIQSTTGYYPPIPLPVVHQTVYAQQMETRPEFSSTNGGNAFRDFLPMRSLERPPPPPPPPPCTVRSTRAETQNSYNPSNTGSSINMHMHNHYTTAPPAPSRPCTSTTDFAPSWAAIAGHGHHMPFEHLLGSNY